MTAAGRAVAMTAASSSSPSAGLSGTKTPPIFATAANSTTVVRSVDASTAMRAPGSKRSRASSWAAALAIRSSAAKVSDSSPITTATRSGTARAALRNTSPTRSGSTSVLELDDDLEVVLGADVHRGLDPATAHVAELARLDRSLEACAPRRGGIRFGLHRDPVAADLDQQVVEVVAVHRAAGARGEPHLPDPHPIVLEQQRRADRSELPLAHRVLRRVGGARWARGGGVRRCARLGGVTTPLHRLEPVGLDFLATAPVRFDFTHALPAPAPVVWAAISADPATWTWFPGLADAHYDSPSPHGVGTRRSVVMDGTAYRETLLAWDEPTRWAYRVDESGDATFRALAEDWIMAEAAGGSTLTWTFAVDPQPELRELVQGARDVIGGV